LDIRNNLFINFYKFFKAPVKGLFNIVRKETGRKLIISQMKPYAFAANTFFITRLIAAVTMFQILLLVCAIH